MGSTKVRTKLSRSPMVSSAAGWNSSLRASGECSPMYLVRVEDVTTE